MQSIACAYTHAPVSPPQLPCHVTETQRAVRGVVASISSGSEAPGGTTAAGGRVPPGGEAAGLVYSQTSGTSPQGPIRVDRQASRVKRLRCSVLTAARLHVQERPRWRVAMLTLTYRPDVDWAPGQISGVVRHIRQWLARKGFDMRFVWVQEFTKKGRPHYHMLLWLPLGLTIPKPDKQRWWPWGMTKIEWARNAVGYIAKYASKGDALVQPAKGARMHGNGGLTGDALVEQRWWKLPGWLRHDVKPSDRVRRSPSGCGGGFVNPGTGEVYKSPWVVFFKHGWVFLERRAV